MLLMLLANDIGDSDLGHIEGGPRRPQAHAVDGRRHDHALDGGLG